DVDGLFCANDQLAVGAFHACQDAGLRVPEDVALVGMDNSRDATVCRPQLSSVDLRFADRGRLAGQMLLDRIHGRYTGAPRRQQVYTELVVRGSSSRRRDT
ncbi:MAG TPA: substrate-binding domain-containing protein, partial [Propionicimonas sp.]|nr:substrate-binding domain-containing protein [Propionicimonas sp.]